MESSGKTLDSTVDFCFAYISSVRFMFKTISIPNVAEEKKTVMQHEFAANSKEKKTYL